MPSPSLESDVLLREYERTGSPRAFEQIVAAHRAHVLAICLRITGNAHDAEDGTQAVFLTLALQARGGNSIHTLRPWLSQVARHVSLDLCKARKRRQAHEQNARRDEEHDLPTAPVDQQELHRLVREQIDKLPSRYRTPMILFYFGGMDLQEMGRQLNVSRKALSVRLLRARRMLAERLARINYPWLSIAIAPLLVEAAVRSGSFGAAPAASVAMTPPLTASILPAWLHAAGPLRQGRLLLTAATVVTFLSSMAGSATLAWRANWIELPSFKPAANWISRQLRQLTPHFSPQANQLEPSGIQSADPDHKPVTPLVVAPVLPMLKTPSSPALSPAASPLARSYDFHLSPTRVIVSGLTSPSELASHAAPALSGSRIVSTKAGSAVASAGGWDGSRSQRSRGFASANRSGHHSTSTAPDAVASIAEALSPAADAGASASETWASIDSFHPASTLEPWTVVGRRGDTSVDLPTCAVTGAGLNMAGTGDDLINTLPDSLQLPTDPTDAFGGLGIDGLIIGPRLPDWELAVPDSFSLPTDSTIQYYAPESLNIVPEPTALGLCGVAGVGLLKRRRRSSAHR